MVDRYVKEHMFDDDVYDPIESTYREAVEDSMRGTYPKKLSEITSAILGTDSVKTDKKTSATGVMGLLTAGIDKLQRNAGLSETTAILVLATAFVLAGPVIFVFLGMILGNASKRQIRGVMKRRYGDTYT